MIRAHHPAETYLLVATHRCQHICWTIVVERLDEAPGCTLYIAKMDKVDAVSQRANSGRDIHPHGRKAPLTEGQSIIWARNQRQSAFEGIYAGEYSANASDRRDGRVIWMQGQFDACLFSDGHNMFKEISKIVPQVFFTDHACF